MARLPEAATAPVAASERLRIIVLGYIVRGPLGGLAWHHLQYVLGLADLGHQVTFIEDSDDYPSCYDPSRDVVDTDPGYGLQFTARAFERLGLGGGWAYYDAHRARWLGPSADRALSLCRSADLVLNLSGVNPLRPWLLQVPARALVDTDPVFTQLRHLDDPEARAAALRHTAFCSFGVHARGAIPDDGLPWQPTRQPIVLRAWPVTPGPATGRLTTVMQWDSYAAREYGGLRYGMKSASFAPYLDLPARAGRRFELALGSASAPRSLLRRHGWALRNPLRPTRDPWSYQRYIQRSRAEFSVAKHGYVAARSGWFSERSAAYLASGRPVVVQQTGFSDWLQADAGVLPFATPDEALAAIEALDRDYAGQCRAARAVAEQYFDARRLLPELIAQVMQPLATEASR